MVSIASDGEVPAFLRRKAAQGKTQYRDGKDGKRPDSL